MRTASGIMRAWRTLCGLVMASPEMILHPKINQVSDRILFSLRQTTWMGKHLVIQGFTFYLESHDANSNEIYF